MVTGYEAAYYGHIQQINEHLKEIRASTERVAVALEQLVVLLSTNDERVPLPPEPGVYYPEA